jgi:hypothetical protein
VDFCFCRQNQKQNRDERFWKPTELNFIGLVVPKIYDCIIITIIVIIRYQTNAGYLHVYTRNK